MTAKLPTTDSRELEFHELTEEDRELRIDEIAAMAAGKREAKDIADLVTYFRAKYAERETDKARGKKSTAKARDRGRTKLEDAEQALTGLLESMEG